MQGKAHNKILLFWSVCVPDIGKNLRSPLAALSEGEMLVNLDTCVAHGSRVRLGAHTGWCSLCKCVQT